LASSAAAAERPAILPSILADARRHGARAAIFGRKLKDAEVPLELIATLRRTVDGELSPG
jgi:hypothetical protein